MSMRYFTSHYQGKIANISSFLYFYNRKSNLRGAKEEKKPRENLLHEFDKVSLDDYILTSLKEKQARSQVQTKFKLDSKFLLGLVS